MSHTDVRIEKPKEFEINKKLRTINERLSKLENMSESHYMTLHNMAELQQDHDSTIKELYAEWQKRKQEQEMKNLQHATNTKIEKEDAESRREKALKRLEARLRAISSDTENPYTVAL